MPCSPYLLPRWSYGIIIGKMNMSQWVNYRSHNGSAGWSSVSSQTISGDFPCQDPSGSPSWSAIASSIGLPWGFLGTETDSSIISSSQENNLVNIKPSVGLTLRYFVAPVSEHQETVRCKATIKDAAHLLTAIATRIRIIRIPLWHCLL